MQIKFKSKVKYTGDNFKKDQIFNIYTGILTRNANKINRKAKEIEKLAIYEKITVQDKVKQIVNYLDQNDNMVFNNVFNPDSCSNIEVATAFLGMLELSKLKEVSLNQDYLFSDINITKSDQFGKVDLSNISN